MQRMNWEGVATWKFFRGVFPRGFLPKAKGIVGPLFHQLQ